MSNRKATTGGSSPDVQLYLRRLEPVVENSNLEATTGRSSPDFQLYWRLLEPVVEKSTLQATTEGEANSWRQAQGPGWAPVTDKK